ncbi:hypothetical protein CVT24_002065 [Panaeolus cyanescens]|uniref:DUF6593 domain-containing protein n=1 Tax=Panaeolus cyanescens TaxID=181874 RepID=A0A409W1E9_9AGAR|nr:hypothetical protein CVT24_002065 [Panaeolus cyanescens]
MATASNDILSWTNTDCRESILFNSWGIVYRFQTTSGSNGQMITTMWRALRPNKEDRVAKLEWAPNGGLGRVILGKHTLRMADITRPEPTVYGCRMFVGPDGLTYSWRPSVSTPTDIELYDNSGVKVAFFRQTRQTRYQIGDVYGELHFLRTAGAGTVTHPPMMDMVTLTAMLYRFCATWNV